MTLTIDKTVPKRIIEGTWIGPDDMGYEQGQHYKVHLDKLTGEIRHQVYKHVQHFKEPSGHFVIPNSEAIINYFQVEKDYMIEYKTS